MSDFRHPDTPQQGEFDLSLDLSTIILNEVDKLRTSKQKEKDYGDADDNYRIVTEVTHNLYRATPGLMPKPLYSLIQMIVLKLVRLFSKGFDGEFIIDNYVDLVNYILIFADSHQKYSNSIGPRVGDTVADLNPPAGDHR